MAIRDKFRRRMLGRMGWAGGNAQENIPNTGADRAENAQTQDTASYSKPYRVGVKPPRKRRRVK